MVSKGQILNGRYRLLALEGEGGMADVYQAQDMALDRIVALKILRAEHESIDAFQEEARAIAKLPHPNIVTVYDVGQDGDVQYIVMEYAEGKTLRHLMQNGPLRIGRAINIATQVCEAVGCAHRKGIVHCDIKPQNILIQADGQVKVTDFGIAHAFAAGTPEQRKPWGTPFYVSPELVSGKQQTPASDVYAIGVVLYEMLSGRVPFEGQTAAEIARQHVINAPPPIEQYNPRVTRYLRQVIDRALAKDPAQRYQNAEEMGKALQAYRQHSLNATQPLQPVAAPETAPVREAVVAAAQPPAPPPAAPKSRVDWVLLLLAGLAFLMVMGLLPLWGTIVTRALVPPTPVVAPSNSGTPTPTQDLTQISTPTLLTATPQPNVLVPTLVGLELEAARQQAIESGLALTVNGQRHSIQVPESHIIEQEPPAGEPVAPGTTVGIVVSLGAETVTMPDTLGFPGAIKRLDLEDLGLTVTITETASVEPTGLVISQTPTAGTVITKGSQVTLTVSSGQQDQVRANLGNKVILSQCTLNDHEFRSGDVVQIIVTWDVIESISESYTVFIHIVDRNGQILAQRDEPPLGGSRLTNTWRPGETLIDTHTLVLPREAPPGDYWIEIGLYQGSQRLPVVDPGMAEAKGNAVVARQITIKTN